MISNVRSEFVGGDQYFYDKDGDVIFYIDGTNRKFIIPSGSALEVAGETVDENTLAVTGLTATADELNLAADDIIGGVSFTIAAEDTNVRQIAVQLKDKAGADLARVGHILIGVFADNGGLAFATGGSTGIELGTGGDGAILPVVAKKLFLCTSEADGDIDLKWTDTGSEAVYLLALLGGGKFIASAVIANT